MRSWPIDYYNFDSELKCCRYMALNELSSQVSNEVSRIITNMIDEAVASIINNNIRRIVQRQIFHYFGEEYITDD